MVLEDEKRISVSQLAKLAEFRQALAKDVAEEVWAGANTRGPAGEKG